MTAADACSRANPSLHYNWRRRNRDKERTMRAAYGLLAILAAAFLAAGCFEGKADVTLNADGTGKIVGDITFRGAPP